MNFSIRIVNADFYTAAPLAGLDSAYSEFRCRKITKLPVVRIFGSTTNGQKTCLHVHGIFPYIYIPFKGDEPRDVYLKQFATSIDFAVHVSQGKASSSSHHVHNIEMVTARSFYGYHDEEQEFMKVSFYSPFIVPRVVELLQSGAVMNTTFQPYEAHIPYIQQMFIDYNLYGMNLLYSSSVMFRTPIQLKQDESTLHESSFHSPTTPVLSPSSITGSPTEMFWNEQTVPRRCRHSLEVERLSISELEVDIKAEHIMNQFDIGTSIGSNPGLVAIWQDERQRRQDEHDDSDISPPVSQDRGNIPLLEAERKCKDRLQQIVSERNILIQSQRQQEKSQTPPNVKDSSTYDENTPIIDQSIVEEVVRSSQRSLSQDLANSTDIEMIEILASLAEDQSQSRRDTETAASSDDEKNEDDSQDEQDSIIMSQQVWDDTDPADYITTEDDKQDNEHKIDGQGSQLRMSQFNFEGLDDTWDVSLLSEDPIPQLDGANDLDDPSTNTKTLAHSLKRPTYVTRSRKPATDKQESQDSLVNLNKEVVRKESKKAQSSSLDKNDASEKQKSQVSRRDNNKAQSSMASLEKKDGSQKQKLQTSSASSNRELERKQDQLLSYSPDSNKTAGSTVQRRPQNAPVISNKQLLAREKGQPKTPSFTSNKELVGREKRLETKTPNEECISSEKQTPAVSFDKALGGIQQRRPTRRLGMSSVRFTARSHKSDRSRVPCEKNFTQDFESIFDEIIETRETTKSHKREQPVIQGEMDFTQEFETIFDEGNKAHEARSHARTPSHNANSTIRLKEVNQISQSRSHEQASFNKSHNANSKDPNTTLEEVNQIRESRSHGNSSFNKSPDTTKNISDSKQRETDVNLPNNTNPTFQEIIETNEASSKEITFSKKSPTTTMKSSNLNKKKNDSSNSGFSLRLSDSSLSSEETDTSKADSIQLSIPSEKDSKDDVNPRIKHVGDCEIPQVKVKETVFRDKAELSPIITVKRETYSLKNAKMPKENEEMDMEEIADACWEEVHRQQTEKSISKKEESYDTIKRRVFAGYKSKTSESKRSSTSLTKNNTKSKVDSSGAFSKSKSLKTSSKKQIKASSVEPFGEDSKTLADVQTKGPKASSNLIEKLKPQKYSKSGQRKALKLSRNSRQKTQPQNVSKTEEKKDLRKIKKYHDKSSINDSECSGTPNSIAMEIETENPHGKLTEDEPTTTAENQTISLAAEHQEIKIQDEESPQNICDREHSGTKDLKVVLTDIAQSKKQAHLYADAFDRWKRWRNEQAKLQKLFSSPPESSFGTLPKVSPKRKRSPRDSPKGKRYGVLNVIVHTSPSKLTDSSQSKLAGSPSSRRGNGSPPFKAIRSLSLNSSGYTSSRTPLSPRKSDEFPSSKDTVPSLSKSVNSPPSRDNVLRSQSIRSSSTTRHHLQSKSIGVSRSKSSDSLQNESDDSSEIKSIGSPASRTLTSPPKVARTLRSNVVDLAHPELVATPPRHLNESLPLRRTGHTPAKSPGKYLGSPSLYSTCPSPTKSIVPEVKRSVSKRSKSIESSPSKSSIQPADSISSRSKSGRCKSVESSPSKSPRSLQFKSNRSPRSKSMDCSPTKSSSHCISSRSPPFKSTASHHKTSKFPLSPISKTAKVQRNILAEFGKSVPMKYETNEIDELFDVLGSCLLKEKNTTSTTDVIEKEFTYEKGGKTPQRNVELKNSSTRERGTPQTMVQRKTDSIAGNPITSTTLSIPNLSYVNEKRNSQNLSERQIDDGEGCVKRASTDSNIRTSSTTHSKASHGTMKRKSSEPEATSRKQPRLSLKLKSKRHKHERVVDYDDARHSVRSDCHEVKRMSEKLDESKTIHAQCVENDSIEIINDSFEELSKNNIVDSDVKDDSEECVHKKPDYVQESHDERLASPSIDSWSNDSPSILDETMFGQPLSGLSPSQGESEYEIKSNDVTNQITVTQRSNGVTKARDVTNPITHSRSHQTFDTAVTQKRDSVTKQNDVTRSFNQSEPFDTINKRSNSVTKTIYVTQPLSQSLSSETCDSSETLDLSSSIEKLGRSPLMENPSETIKSDEEIENYDSLMSSSPDLFDSALFNMSYLSPERRDEDRSSPPLPFTPNKSTKDELSPSSLAGKDQILDQILGNSDTCPLGNSKQVTPSVSASSKTSDKGNDYPEKSAKEQRHATLKKGRVEKECHQINTESDSFQLKTASPALSGLSANNFSGGFSENNDLSINKLSVGFSQAEPKVSSIDDESQNTKEKTQHSRTTVCPLEDKSQNSKTQKGERTRHSRPTVSPLEDKSQNSKAQKGEFKARVSQCTGETVSKERKSEFKVLVSQCTGETVNRTCTTGSYEGRKSSANEVTRHSSLSVSQKTEDSKKIKDLLHGEEPISKKTNDYEGRESSAKEITRHSSLSGSQNTEDSKKIKDVLHTEESIGKKTNDYFRSRAEPFLAEKSNEVGEDNKVDDPLCGKDSEKQKENQDFGNITNPTPFVKNKHVAGNRQVVNLSSSENSTKNKNTDDLNPTTTEEDLNPVINKPDTVSALNVIRQYCFHLERERMALMGLELDSSNMDLIPQNYCFLRHSPISTVPNDPSQDADVCSTRQSEVSSSCSSNSMGSNKEPAKDKQPLSFETIEFSSGKECISSADKGDLEHLSGTKDKQPLSVETIGFSSGKKCLSPVDDDNLEHFSASERVLPDKNTRENNEVRLSCDNHWFTQNRPFALNKKLALPKTKEEDLPRGLSQTAKNVMSSSSDNEVSPPEDVSPVVGESGAYTAHNNKELTNDNTLLPQGEISPVIGESGACSANNELANDIALSSEGEISPVIENSKASSINNSNNFDCVNTRLSQNNSTGIKDSIPSSINSEQNESFEVDLHSSSYPVVEADDIERFPVKDALKSFRNEQTNSKHGPRNSSVVATNNDDSSHKDVSDINDEEFLPSDEEEQLSHGEKIIDVKTAVDERMDRDLKNNKHSPNPSDDEGSSCTVDEKIESQTRAPKYRKVTETSLKPSDKHSPNPSDDKGSSFTVDEKMESQTHDPKYRRVAETSLNPPSPRPSVDGGSYFTVDDRMANDSRDLQFRRVAETSLNQSDRPSPRPSDVDSSVKKSDVIIQPRRKAPSSAVLLESMKVYRIPLCRYQEPFYGEPNDVPDSTMDIGGRLLKVQSNRVKNLPNFETRSPFIGLQEWRQLLSSNHETSFLRACQENIGTTETFLTGIENNAEMKIAFMGDRRLSITPCKPPPHPRIVHSWAEKKMTHQCDHVKNTKKFKSGKDGLKNQDNAKETKVEKDVRSSHKTANLEQNQRNLSKTSHHVLKQTENTDFGSEFTKSHVTHGKMSQRITNYRETVDRSEDGKPTTNSVEPITSPNTLFSPEEDMHVFKFAGIQKKDKEKSILKCAVNDDDLEPKDGPRSAQKRPRELNLPLQSTPIPQGRHTNPSQVASPRYSTPAMKGGLPRMPLLTPITASTQGLSAEKQSAVLSGNSGKARSNQDAPRRQLMLSQLKLCTPEMALRRRVSEVGSEIEGPSPINTAGYKVPQLNIQDAKASHEVQHLTLLSVELHVRTRKERKPDPEYDPICALFYHAQTDSQCPTSKVTGIICVDKDSAELSATADKSKDCSRHDRSTSMNSTGSVCQTQKRALLARSGITQYHIQYVKQEQDLFPLFLSLVRKWDPDVLIGYEIQMLSWGYLIQRALVFDLDLGKLLSRVSGSSSQSNVDAEKDQWGAAHNHELKIGGRIILNVWRLMRHEAALTIYSFENVAFHFLRERIPLFTFRTLSDWWDHKTDVHRWRTVEHYVTRCHGNIRLLEQVDFIGRTSELARLFGILFYSVISRGSQFRVESMMLRLSKPLNYLAMSPSVQQRNRMNAPEVIPLVLEPESRFYSNPVLVLDFQSLYPSIIIAYNYCYSTCLGRVSCLEDLGGFKFGASTLSVPPTLLKKLEDDIHISPNGVAFVKSNVRLGVLPKMLEDILNTRIMVKSSMKKWKKKKSVYRMLDARQLGLKLIANVTYGYTAAHFSGRMPCVEVGDSVVRKARETLEHAIHVVNTTSKWGAKVVYGDTDSMFVLLDGASKDEAFRIGKEISETITSMNPKPVKLKFEKVYLPCVLQTKKRYVGYMYETPDQKEPVFDAKGIETVRRDSCPAVAKVLEKSLRVLFETKDVSLVKRYVQRQFTKVMEGRTSLPDLTFAKEYRGMKSYKPGACVPALELTRQMLKEDRRSEPRVGERVPYVVVYGSPGLPLIKLVRRPLEVLQDSGLRINSLYYITKQLIPPLNRALSLIGVDVNTWFADVPRTSRVRVQPFNSSDTRKKTISHYFTTTNCPVCQQTTITGLCTTCTNDPQKAVVTLNHQIRQYERRHRHLAQICYQCCGSRDSKLCCVSIDCPVFHKLVKVSRDLEPSQHYRRLIDDILT